MASISRTVQVNVVGDSSGATRAMGQVASSSDSTTSKVGASFSRMFGTLSSAAGPAFAPIGEAIDAMSGHFDNLGKGAQRIGGILTGVGAAGVGMGTLLTAAGSKDQAAQQQLQQAVENTGHSYDDFKGRIEDTIKSQAKFGHSASDTQNALQNLTQASGDPTTALNLMSTAADLAAAKHESLTTASTTLSQILAGKGTRALAQFGITTQQVKDAGQNHLAVINLLSQKLNGQASAAADTFTGKLQGMKTEIENQVASIGQKYGPTLTGLSAGMTAAGTAVTFVTSVLGKFKTAQEAANLGTEAATAAKGLETTADAAEAAGEATEGAAATLADMATLPLILVIGAIVAAVALLGVGIYELATHWSEVWGTIKTVVGDAWHFIDNDFIQPIEGFFSSVVGFISDHWQLILAILTGPIGLAVLWIKDHFQSIVDFFTGIPAAIGAIATDIGKGLANGVIWGINAIIGAWDWFCGLLKIPSVDIGPIHFGGWDIGSSLMISQIPYLAAGGIINSPTIAMLGEAGPEAVVPLSRAAGMGLGGGGGGGEGDVYLDSTKVGKVLWEPLRSQGLRNRRGAVSVGLG